MPGLFRTVEAIGGGTEFELEDAVEDELGVRKVAIEGGGPVLRLRPPPPADPGLAAVPAVVAAILSTTLVL